MRVSANFFLAPQALLKVGGLKAGGLLDGWLLPVGTLVSHRLDEIEGVEGE